MKELDLQALVIDWARLKIYEYPALEWLYACPNGSNYGKDRRLAAIQAKRMRDEGLLPGVPDLFLPYPARGKHGYYLELKRPGAMNEVRQGQREFMAWAESVGYLCNVFDNFEDITESLVWYLSDGIALPRASWDIAIPAQDRQGR